MTSRRPVLARGAVLVLVLAGLLLSACSSKGKHPGAAEPATAPPISTAPAGHTVRVGAEPEGIAYDPDTRLIAVAVRNRDRLLLLDAGSLIVRRTVVLPGSVRHLQLARPGGPVLVPDESAKELVEVALPGGTTHAIAVGKQPHDAAALADGEIAVGNEFGKSVSVIKGGHVRRTITGFEQPGGVIGAGSTFAVVDVHAFTLSTYDVASLRRSAITKAGKGPTHGVLLGGGRLLVADTRGNELLVYRISPLTLLGRLATPGTPYGLASDASTNTVWVTLTARNEVIGVDVAGATPKVTATYATVRQPNTVAVAPGSHQLWVTGTADGVVQSITR